MGRSSRLTIAAAAAAVIILAAPYSQQLVERLVAQGGDRLRDTALAATVIPIAALLLVTIVRIRDRRLLRFGALAAAVALGAGFMLLSALTSAETFHFVEYGGVALLFYWACRPLGDSSVLVLPIVAAVLAGTLDEWFQWFIPLRAGEARDVALNAVAGTCGLLAGVGYAPPDVRSSPRVKGAAATRIATWLALSGVVFLLFFHTVHVGHEIDAGPIGTFRSRYSAGQLAGVAADRARQWRTNPPIVLRRFSREDQYLTEGLWHVQRRNRAWNDGDVLRAWRENLILERYYEPVLDAPSYSSQSGHRWPADQRADAEARSGDAGAPFVSDAYPYPLYVWPAWLSPLLLLKLILVPALVAAVTVAVRKWGPAVGGWLAGLPLVAGPVLVFYGIEQGSTFAARAAQGTMAAMAANTVYGVLYSWLARALPWYACVAIGWTTFGVAVLALEALEPGLLASFALPVAAAVAAVFVMPPPEPVRPLSTPPKGDLIIRLVASGALVVMLTSLARRLGPEWSGLLAAFPVITTTITAFTHVQRGPAAVIDFFRGFIPATIGFVVFCLVLAVLIERMGLVVATATALGAQLIVHGTVVRWLTRPSAVSSGAT